LRVEVSRARRMALSFVPVSKISRGGVKSKLKFYVQFTLLHAVCGAECLSLNLTSGFLQGSCSTGHANDLARKATIRLHNIRRLSGQQLCFSNSISSTFSTRIGSSRTYGCDSFKASPSRCAKARSKSG